MVLQLLPQDFVVDDQPGFHDPRSMLASVIEANAHLITISTQEHTNLIGAINRAHLSVDETILKRSPPVTRRCCRKTGARAWRCVDIGRIPRSWSVTTANRRRWPASLRICGDHFSRDLAHALRIPLESAAIVKHEFGSAVSHGHRREQRGGIADGRRAITAEIAPRSSAQLINEMLESRAVELFEMVQRGTGPRRDAAGHRQRSGDRGRRARCCRASATSPSACWNVRRASGWRRDFWTGRKRSMVPNGPRRRDSRCMRRVCAARSIWNGSRWACWDEFCDKRIREETNMDALKFEIAGRDAARRAHQSDRCGRRRIERRRPHV